MKWCKKLLPFAVCLLAACNNNAPATTAATTTDTTETDTINYALNEDSVKMQMANTTPPEGFYAVTLPCSNCKGIEHTVLFNRDLSYRLEENVLGSESLTTKVTGAWKPVNGDIWLYKDSSVQARYTWNGDTLNYIDLKSGVRIPLRPLQNILDNDVWKEKRNEGVVFFGTGTEPFWNIRMHKQQGITLSFPEPEKPIRFKYTAPVATPDSTVYQTGKDTAKLRVVIYNRFGNDGMSDAMYPNRVTVYYKNRILQGSGVRYN